MRGSGYNIVKKVAYSVAGIGIILLAFYFVLILIKGDFKNICDFLDWLYCQLISNPGEFIGGTVGVMFTLAATLFMFITFTEQRKQFDETQKGSYYARFESTYFNILGMLPEVKDNVNDNILESFHERIQNIDEFYTVFTEYFDQKIRIERGLKLAESNMSKYDVLSAEVLADEQAVGDVYEEFMSKNPCNIGYYFRYIYNTVKFVYDQKGLLGESEKERYTNLLQSQLSDKELALLFYDAISGLGENKEGKKLFRQMLDDTHFLENIKESVLLNREHHLFYPHTHFKFMNRDDYKKVQ